MGAVLRAGSLSERAGPRHRSAPSGRWAKPHHAQRKWEEAGLPQSVVSPWRGHQAITKSHDGTCAQGTVGGSSQKASSTPCQDQSCGEPHRDPAGPGERALLSGAGAEPLSRVRPGAGGLGPGWILGRGQSATLEGGVGLAAAGVGRGV